MLGQSDVVEALNQRRVHKLVIEEGFDGPAGAATTAAPSARTPSPPTRARTAAGARARCGDLGEAIVARGARNGAEVEVVAHANKLHSYRGVGAFLRQTSQNGLRGANPAYPMAPGVTR